MNTKYDEKTNSMLELPQAMQNSLTSEIPNVLINIAEAGLDTIMNEGFLKEIPILSTAVSLYKLGYSVNERYYIKKLASFVLELNKGIVDEKKRERYRRKITDDAKKRYRELEYILILIDRQLHADQPSLLAKLYLAYLDENISWEDFTKYAVVIDRFLPGDCETLLSASTYKTIHDINTDSIQRLIALGLLIEGYRDIPLQVSNEVLAIAPPEITEKKERNYTRTDFGNILVSIISSGEYELL